MMALGHTATGNWAVVWAGLVACMACQVREWGKERRVGGGRKTGTGILLTRRSKAILLGALVR